MNSNLRPCFSQAGRSSNFWSLQSQSFLAFASSWLVVWQIYIFWSLQNLISRSGLCHISAGRCETQGRSGHVPAREGWEGLGRAAGLADSTAAMSQCHPMSPFSPSPPVDDVCLRISDDGLVDPVASRWKPFGITQHVSTLWYLWYFFVCLYPYIIHRRAMTCYDVLQATSWFQGREQLLRLDIMVGSTGGHETGLEFEVIIVISLSPEQPSLCLPVSNRFEHLQDVWAGKFAARKNLELSGNQSDQVWWRKSMAAALPARWTILTCLSFCWL